MNTFLTSGSVESISWNAQRAKLCTGTDNTPKCAHTDNNCSVCVWTIAVCLETRSKNGENETSTGLCDLLHWKTLPAICCCQVHGLRAQVTRSQEDNSLLKTERSSWTGRAASFFQRRRRRDFGPVLSVAFPAVWFSCLLNVCLLLLVIVFVVCRYPHCCSNDETVPTVGLMRDYLILSSLILFCSFKEIQASSLFLSCSDFAATFLRGGERVSVAGRKDSATLCQTRCAIPN